MVTHLGKKPTSGGIPLKDSNKIGIMRLIIGDLFKILLEFEINIKLNTQNV
jgi:hypothetical protein